MLNCCPSLFTGKANGVVDRDAVLRKTWVNVKQFYRDEITAIAGMKPGEAGDTLDRSS